MQSLLVLYSALAVFGLGVTIVDLFGVFDQLGSSDHGADADSGEAGADGHDADDGSAHDADADTADSAEADHSPDADSGHAHGDRGSYVAAANAGTRLVAKTIGTLRSGVYFSLGAGPTGLFAVLTGVAPAASLAWSAGAGLFIAILAKALRAFIRKDLDSSIKPEEFLMDSARISVPVSPGAMGKAVVRRYGRDNELFVRCKDSGKALPKGAEVHIVDWDDDCYWVE